MLCTVHAANAEHPLEVYRFFRDELQARYIQLIPIVERATAEMLPLANLGWSTRGSDAPAVPASTARSSPNVRSRPTRGVAS